MKTSIRALVPAFVLLVAGLTLTASASQAAVRANAPVKVKLAPQKAAHGQKVKVRGVSNVAAGRVGVLYRGTGNSKWQRLKTVRTNVDGIYDTDVTARRSGEYRVAGAAGVRSPTRQLKVRSRLKLKPVKNEVKLGGKLTLRGIVKPKGKRRIKVVIKGRGGKTIRTTTKAHGGFAVNWRPKRSGNYTVRVFGAGNRAAIGDASRRVKVTGLRPTFASYFGPGLYGGPLACGGRLSPSTKGVAHKTLPCGSKVKLHYRGRTVTTRVIDRGPYIGGREFDLTTATRNQLRFGDLGSLWTNR